MVKQPQTKEQLCRFLFPKEHREKRCACHTIPEMQALRFMDSAMSDMQFFDTITRNLR